MGADNHQIGAAVLLLDHNLPAGVAAPESGQDPVSPDAEGVREPHEVGARVAVRPDRDRKAVARAAGGLLFGRSHATGARPCASRCPGFAAHPRARNS